MHAHIPVSRGDFRAAKQWHAKLTSGEFGLLPAGGGVMVGNGHAMQAKRLRLSNQRMRRFRTIGESGVAMYVPSAAR